VGDMTETYKVLSGIYDTSVSPEIPIIWEYATQGNSLKIANRRCHYNFGSIHLARRWRYINLLLTYLNVWNSLPKTLSLLPLLYTNFKIDWINTEHHKNLDMNRKQNYQEPKLEAELNFEFFVFYHYIF